MLGWVRNFGFRTWRLHSLLEVVLNAQKTHFSLKSVHKSYTWNCMVTHTMLLLLTTVRNTKGTNTKLSGGSKALNTRNKVKWSLFMHETLIISTILFCFALWSYSNHTVSMDQKPCCTLNSEKTVASRAACCILSTSSESEVFYQSQGEIVFCCNNSSNSSMQVKTRVEI